MIPGYTIDKLASLAGTAFLIILGADASLVIAGFVWKEEVLFLIPIVTINPLAACGMVWVAFHVVSWVCKPPKNRKDPA